MCINLTLIFLRNDATSKHSESTSTTRDACPKVRVTRRVQTVEGRAAVRDKALGDKPQGRGKDTCGRISPLVSTCVRLLVSQHPLGVNCVIWFGLFGDGKLHVEHARFSVII